MDHLARAPGLTTRPPEEGRVDDGVALEDDGGMVLHGLSSGSTICREAASAPRRGHVFRFSGGAGIETGIVAHGEPARAGPGIRAGCLSHVAPGTSVGL